MEIRQLSELSEGARFAKRDWMDAPKNKVVYRLLGEPKPRRKTCDVTPEIGGGGKIRMRKREWVYVLGDSIASAPVQQQLFNQ